MNIVTGATHTLRGSIGGWSDTSAFAPVGGGGSPTLTSSAFSKYVGFGSLSVLPADTQDIYLYGGTSVSPSSGFYALNGAQPENDVDVEWPESARLRAFVYVYAEEPMTAQGILVQQWGTSFSQNASAIGVETRILADRWNLIEVHSELASIDATQLLIGVKISGHAGNAMNLAFPVIQWIDEPAYNEFAHETYLRLPQYLRESDGLQSSPDRPLFRYLEAMGSSSKDILRHQRTFRYVPPDEATDDLPEKTSGLTDASVCNLEYLPWLASVVGMRLYSPTVSVTTWESLEDGYSTWDELEGLADWDALEAASPSASTYDEYLRSQVLGLFLGPKAGTVETLKKIILDGQTNPSNPLEIQVFPNYNDDPWAILIQFIDETVLPGLDLTTVLERSLAAGYELTVENPDPASPSIYGPHATGYATAMNATITISE